MDCLNVITIHFLLQLVGCSLDLSGNCTIRQLFAIKCVCRNIILNVLDPNSEYGDGELDTPTVKDRGKDKDRDKDRDMGS